MSNAETVQTIYEAFGRGDVETIVAQVADDVKWDDWADNTAQREGVPWMTARAGKDGVRAFFQSLDALEFRQFEPQTPVASGNCVVVPVRLEALVKATGRVMHEEEVHFWTFNAAGKIASFRHYIDTAKHIRAYQGV